jgi:hypothetical protein
VGIVKDTAVDILDVTVEGRPNACACGGDVVSLNWLFITVDETTLPVADSGE